jgi:hypothetical protein
MNSDDNSGVVPLGADGLGAGLNPAVLPAGRFAGREAFQQCIRDAFAVAAREGWKEIILCDATFADWPLRERVVVESLQAWAKTGRHLTMVATRYDAVLRDQPRFVAWRRTWSHIIECRQCRNDDPLDFPSAIYSPAWAMQRLDLNHSAGVSGTEPSRRVNLRELLNEKIRGSSPGFPASTLGL